MQKNYSLIIFSINSYLLERICIYKKRQAEPFYRLQYFEIYFFQLKRFTRHQQKKASIYCLFFNHNRIFVLRFLNIIKLIKKDDFQKYLFSFSLTKSLKSLKQDSYFQISSKINKGSIITAQMNKQFPDALSTLLNSKESQIPPFAEQTLEIAKSQVRRLLDCIKAAEARGKINGEQKTQDQLAFEKAERAILFDQIYRIKRFLLIYYDFRCDRIEDQFWTYGGDLKHSEKAHLSQAEKVYYNTYKGLVMDYIDETKVELTIDLDPPLQTEVEYRMLEDCGEVLDDFGHMVKLEKNSCGFIKKRLIEPYVKQGLATIKKK